MIWVINLLAIFLIFQLIVLYLSCKSVKRLHKEQINYIYEVIKTINPKIPSPKIIENRAEKPLIRKKGKSYMPSHDIEYQMGSKREDFFD